MASYGDINAVSIRICMCVCVCIYLQLVCYVLCVYVFMCLCVLCYAVCIVCVFVFCVFVCCLCCACLCMWNAPCVFMGLLGCVLVLQSSGVYTCVVCDHVHVACDVSAALSVHLLSRRFHQHRRSVHTCIACVCICAYECAWTYI